jgi:nucleotide-binding universal stress UspA family protein
MYGGLRFEGAPIISNALRAARRLPLPLTAAAQGEKLVPGPDAGTGFKRREEAAMFKNILIPTDGSELSQRAVRKAIDLARLHQARLVGVHVIPDYHLLIAYEGAFDPVTEERIEEEAKTRAEGYLAFVRRGADDAGVPCETVCETSDHPYDAILKTADSRGCDLIVMTSHGRKGLAAVLLGSETRKVLTHARIPVLVVR